MLPDAASFAYSASIILMSLDEKTPASLHYWQGSERNLLTGAALLTAFCVRPKANIISKNGN